MQYKNLFPKKHYQYLKINQLHLWSQRQQKLKTMLDNAYKNKTGNKLMSGT